MILLICSSIDGKLHESVSALSEKIINRGESFHILNIHNLNLKKEKWSLVNIESKIQLQYNDINFIPQKIYVMRPIRSDAIINLPTTSLYPNLHRVQRHQFIQDIRFAFEDATWLPGNFENIERADSKPILMKKANNIGIQVPKFTIDSQQIILNGAAVCQKSLGYPFSITIDTAQGMETGVMTSPIFHFSTIENFKEDDQFWQWQEFIPYTKHVRSFVIKTKFWSRAFEHKKSSEYKDFRKFNRELPTDFLGEEYILPDELREKVIKLMRNIGISICAPEFLVKEDGSHILIDLNPCGDWYGFFSKREQEEISENLVDILL